MEQVGITGGILVQIISPPVVLRRQCGLHFPAGGQDIVGLGGVKLHEEPDLFQVVQATDLLAFAFGLGQCWQQHSGQDGDDGNDDQQFNERERGGHPSLELCFFHAL